MKYLVATFVLCAGFAVAASVAKKTGARSQPIEVGEVKWGRDFDAALAQSKKSRKPVLLLFQEVPGCTGCKKFGGDVLSHPLLVEAIEDEFVPMLVHNNRSQGADLEILKRYKEPAWNFQVIRFLDADGKDVIPRKDRVWTVSAVAGRMIEALEASDREVPNYLRTLAPLGKTEQAAFAMHCFWTGEMEIGKIDGVVATEAGWLEGREVTLVDFQPGKVSLNELTKKAAAAGCAQKVYPEPGKRYRKAKSSDQAKQIQGTPVAKVPNLTALQRTKLNSFWRTDRKRALEWLSPRQVATLKAQR